MTSEADIMRMWQRYYCTLLPFYRAPYGIQIHECHYARWIDSEKERARLLRPMADITDELMEAGLRLE